MDNTEFIIAPSGTVFVVGSDSIERARSMEISVLICLQSGFVSRDDFNMLVSRLRGFGEHRVILTAGSQEASWVQGKVPARTEVFRV